MSTPCGNASLDGSSCTAAGCRAPNQHGLHDHTDKSTTTEMDESVRAYTTPPRPPTNAGNVMPALPPFERGNR